MQCNWLDANNYVFSFNCKEKKWGTANNNKANDLSELGYHLESV